MIHVVTTNTAIKICNYTLWGKARCSGECKERKHPNCKFSVILTGKNINRYSQENTEKNRHPNLENIYFKSDWIADTYFVFPFVLHFQNFNELENTVILKKAEKCNNQYNFPFRYAPNPLSMDTWTSVLWCVTQQGSGPCGPLAGQRSHLEPSGHRSHPW